MSLYRISAVKQLSLISFLALAVPLYADHCETGESVEHVANVAANITATNESPLAAIKTCYEPYFNSPGFKAKFEQADLRVQERFYFEYADACEKAATGMSASDTGQKLLRNAAKQYFNYAVWYQGLTGEEHKRLRQKGRDRSIPVVIYLGNTYDKLEAWEDLLDRYEELSRSDIGVFGVEALRLWYDSLIDLVRFSPFQPITPRIFNLRMQMDPSYEGRWTAFQEALYKLNGKGEKSVKLTGVLKQLLDLVAESCGELCRGDA